MVSLWTRFRYLAHKFDYSICLTWMRYEKGQITDREMGNVVWKNLSKGKMTLLYVTRGEEMVPTLGGQGGILLVRKLPAVDLTTCVFIGDVVVLKHPEKQGTYLVRRLAATEGCEMVSTNEKEEPFVLEKDQCWVLSDNDKLKPKEACDSRIFGPMPMSDIVGRVIYCLKTAVDHGPVQNSHFGMTMDSSVLEVELDVEDMVKHHILKKKRET